MPRIAVAIFTTGWSKQYHYLVPEGDSPKVGDVILTSVQLEYDGQPCPDPDKADIVKANWARIIDVRAEPAGITKATRVYLGRVPRAQIAQLTAYNKRSVDKENLRRDARAKLDMMLAEEEPMRRYRELVKRSKVARDLLSVLES